MTEILDVTQVTRLEVIDHRSGAVPFGRVFTAYDCAIELSRQDGGRTLKVFVDAPTPRSPAPEPPPILCECGHLETAHRYADQIGPVCHACRESPDSARRDEQYHRFHPAELHCASCGHTEAQSDVEEVIRRATQLGMRADAAPLNVRLISSVQRLTPTPEELAALKAAAYRVHSETDEGRSILRAMCVCGYSGIGAHMPLCDFLRRIQRDAED